MDRRRRIGHPSHGSLFLETPARRRDPSSQRPEQLDRRPRQTVSHESGWRPDEEGRRPDSVNDADTPRASDTKGCRIYSLLP